MVSPECLQRKEDQQGARRRGQKSNEHGVQGSLKVLELESLANFVNWELALVEELLRERSALELGGRESARRARLTSIRKGMNSTGLESPSESPE
jgi:hypothetical protein